MLGVSVIASCAAALSFAGAPGSVTQEGSSEGVGVASSIPTAKRLMLQGRVAEAQALLRRLDEQYPLNNDVDFLLGMVAMEQKQFGRSIYHFRSILVRYPNAVRVRLELARAFYLKRDFVNALQQFQFARAGNPPANVVAAIDRFLGAIRREKRWAYSLGVAIAPDSNVNNGSSSDEVILFGLPFELGKDARARSGIGAVLDGSLEFAPRLGNTTRFRVGAAAQRREHSGRRFDQMTVAVHAGPRFVQGRWDLSLLGTAFQRRYGGLRLNEGAGARAEATYYSDSRTALSLGLAAYALRYPDHALHDGRSYSATAGAVRALSPSSSLMSRLSVIRKEAKADDLASWSGTLAMGYQRDLPGGFTAFVEPSYTHSRFDAPDGFFGIRRKDYLMELRVAALNRRIVVRGFTPRIGVTLSRRRSSIDLHNYGQRRVEIGFTSTF